MDTRLGIIGAGWVARTRHLPALQRIAGVEIRLICSSNRDKALAVAREFGISQVADTWEEIAKSPNVDAVVIATPPGLHCTATLACLAAGKHVLCQGRMARSLREAQEMLRAAQGSRLVTALYPPRPGLKGDRVVRRLLHKENFVGDIREVRVTGMALAESKEGYDWTQDSEVMGVNAMTLGMWAEVLNRWVGPATRVVAIGRCHERQRRTVEGAFAEAIVPDSLALAAELKCGATASYHFGIRTALGPGHSIEIYGSRGTLAYQFFAEEIRGTPNGGKSLELIPIPPEEERAHSTDAEFIQAIREQTPVAPDFEEGVRYMEFCEAAALSLETAAAVAIPLTPAMHSWGRLLN